MPSAAFGGCRAKGVTLYADIAVRARQPHLEGPFRMDTLACPEMGLALSKPAADLDITLDETLDHWRGEADLRSEEHTSELQSLMRISYAGFCLKKTKVSLII